MRQNSDSGQKKGRIILGITGGVGAGKSTILSYLKDRYRAVIIEADAVGHQVQQPGEPCWKQIADLFGSDILKEDGSINRVKLGAVVYSDRAKMDQLNAIVHPAVKKRILEKIDSLCSAGLPAGTHLPEGNAPFAGLSRGNTQNLIVIEAALLLEDHYDEICDALWYIYADERVRAERLMSSRGYSPEKVRQIMNNQLSEDEFRSRCDAVIDNSDTDLSRTFAQVDNILKDYADHSFNLSESERMNR